VRSAATSSLYTSLSIVVPSDSTKDVTRCANSPSEDVMVLSSVCTDMAATLSHGAHRRVDAYCNSP